MTKRAEDIRRVGIAGSGLIGRSWSLVFASAGLEVALWDAVPRQVEEALAWARGALGDMERAGLVQDPAAVAGRIRGVGTLEEVAQADWVQENTSEIADVKSSVFAALDEAAPAEATLASSSSGLGPSTFAADCKGRHRCLVAHPVNPPHLVPLVEVVGASWTDPEVVKTAMELMRRVGQVPVEVKREIQGFILNRLQGALLDEAFRLVAGNYADADAVDACVVHGLAFRWSFMGPFETIDLNAPGGIADYVAKYARMYWNMHEDRGADAPWDDQAVTRVAEERRRTLPLSSLSERQAWRDRTLMQKAASRRRAG